MNNLCLTVRAGNPVHDAGVHLEGCNGSAAQRWTTGGANSLISDVTSNPSMCLDDQWGNGRLGAGVDTWDCYGGAAIQLLSCTGGPNQQWRMG